MQRWVVRDRDGREIYMTRNVGSTSPPDTENWTAISTMYWTLYAGGSGGRTSETPERTHITVAVRA